MDICNARTRILLLLLVLILRFCGSCFAEESHKAPERPSFSNFVQESVAILKKSHPSHWDKLKSLVHQMQLQFFPPNLDFRSRDDANGGQGVVDEMKEAVEKSFGRSKDAVEESAKSAAKVMEEAVDRVKENLVLDPKDNKDQNLHDEL